jgi:hypothetical protein
MRTDETPAAELWSRTLVQIPSLFGRLVYLSSLREPHSGLYQHFGFAQRFSEKIADQTIGRSHKHAFMDWLCFSLEQQRQDLGFYLDSVGGDRRAIVTNWLEWPPFMNWMPPQSRPAERELFRSDMEIILELIRLDGDGAANDRSA